MSRIGTGVMRTKCFFLLREFILKICLFATSYHAFQSHESFIHPYRQYVHQPWTSFELLYLSFPFRTSLPAEREPKLRMSKGITFQIAKTPFLRQCLIYLSNIRTSIVCNYSHKNIAFALKLCVQKTLRSSVFQYIRTNETKGRRILK